jgi:hypothetical protein
VGTISLNMNLESWCQNPFTVKFRSLASFLAEFGCRAAEQGFTQKLVLSQCYAGRLLIGGICMETYHVHDRNPLNFHSES